MLQPFLFTLCFEFLDLYIFLQISNYLSCLCIPPSCENCLLDGSVTMKWFLPFLPQILLAFQFSWFKVKHLSNKKCPSHSLYPAQDFGKPYISAYPILRWPCCLWDYYIKSILQINHLGSSIYKIFGISHSFRTFTITDAKILNQK